MNKILMDGDKLYLSEEINSIEVNGYVTIYINNLSNVKINIKVNDQAVLNILDFSVDTHDKEIIIHQSSDTKVSYIHTFNSEKEHNFKYRANLNGNNSINNVNISGVSKNYVSLDIDGCVKEETLNNVLNENIKVLTIGGKCFVAPQLHVSVKDVLANHNTAISNVREDELFYLMSKGIERCKSIKLIEDAYVYGYIKEFDEEFFDLIKG